MAENSVLEENEVSDSRKREEHMQNSGMDK